MTDIIFLIDGSTSMNPPKFNKVKQFVADLVDKIDIDGVQIGAIQFSTKPHLEFQLDKFTEKTELMKGIKSITQKTGDTYTGLALNFTADYFDQLKGGRPGVLKYLILITDGDAHDSVSESAKVIRDRGITVLAIGIGIPPNSTTDTLMNIGGSQDNINNIDNFDNLEKILAEILFKICKPTDCKRMEIADIVFVIDGSSSITAPQFDSMKDFMINLVNQSEVETDRVRFGAVLYDDNPQTKFQLDEFTSKTKIRDAIIGMELKGGDTYTARALNHAKKLLDSERGGRKPHGVQQFLIVITGGGARDKSNLPAEAKAIRDNDIDILAIGVNGAKEDELLKIGGLNDKWFYVQSFDDLKSLPKNISKKLCNKIKPACGKADIVFLIDGSESITDVQFDAIKEFLKEVVNLFAVSREEVQIGVAQFSKEQQAEIYLNESDSQTTLLGKIEKINQLKEGTYIGAALTFVKELFEPSAGSRKQDAVPQYLLLITDGDSRDLVGGPAKDLRQESIKIIAFNVGKLNTHQLRIITGDDENIVKVPDFNLIKVKRRVARDVCRVLSAGDCIIDIAVGFDLPGWFGSQNMFTGQQKLQLKLEEIVQRITSASDISCVSGSQTVSRVAFYIQSVTGQVVFETKFEKYSPDIINNLTAIRTAAKIDLNVEYLESLWNKFEETTSKAKVILIFTDGLDDTKERFKKTAKRLSEKGVHALITVALEGALNVDDIPLVEFGRGFGYKQQLSIGMEDIGSALHRQINAVVEKECCNVFCKCVGEPGAHGPQGRKGKKGNAGAKGFLGYQGEEGGPGERGPLGTNGTRGNEGCIGPKGPKGKAGYPGEKGIDGYHGIDGIIGEQGDYGVPGAPGEKGNSGNPGRKGQKGDVGERGVPGLRGDRGEAGINNNTRGPKGERGDLGLLGDPGEDGDPGKRGGAGNPGLHGHRGPPGKKGQKRKTGERGRKGDRGIHGPQGVSGPSGTQGPKGELGARGWQGLPGSPGHKGIDGILGLTGQNGDLGNRGDKGVRGPSGPRGLTGMDGRDGFGPQGSKGKKGDRGSQGNPGQKGEDGKPGQSGEQGPKGMKGNRGSDGDLGDPGEPGEFGFLGLKGPRGPSGPPYTPCDLISTVRTNCPCCSQRRGECPVYPTELAFALDMSAGVTLPIFERMKGIVINLLQNINIAENNCPIGARVAVLTYNNVARPFIRFSDFKKKQLLLKKLEELAHERSTRRRNIGIGMQFVARNTFKRVRNGVLVKKIAVFITNGGSKDTKAIATAASQFSASGIIPVIISFKDIPEVERAFKVDTVKVVVLPSQQQDSEELLHRLLLCTLCFDKCEPHDLCLGDAQPSPLPVNLDIAFVVDDLQQMETTQSETVQHFLNSMLNTFLSSTEPKASDLHPRVALVQHTPSYSPRYGNDPSNLEFGILDYTTKTLKKRHIQGSFSQLEGSSGIDSTIEWSLKNFFLNATNQPTYKVFFTIFSGETSIDEKKLLEISQEAKCKGFTIFALVLGEVTNVTVLEEFVSFPFDQHLVHLDRILEAEMEYAQKFAVAFLKNLATGINSYPPPDLVKECGGIKSQDTVKEAETKPSLDLELVVITGDSEEPQSYTNNYDECALNQDEGDCNNYAIKWFFNNKEKGCTRFWYGGCGGNKNRFDTRQECEALCLKPAP